MKRVAINRFGRKERASCIHAGAKFALAPGLNLDRTVNSDFSQVEVDDPSL